MSCYSCASSFGLFKKEVGCKNCGYSFCKDCLSRKAEIPKLNNEKHRVCLKCYKILTGQAQSNPKPEQYSPPEAYKKRMAKLDKSSQSAPEKKILNTDPQSKMSKKFKNMSKEDIAIAQRLEKLKENKDAKPTPSTKEIEQRLENIRKDPNAAPPPSDQDLVARLANLKGQDSNNVNKPHSFPADKRNQPQQIEDLLQEISDEVEIDSHGTDHAEDVQNRLDAVRGKTNFEKPGDLQNNLDTPNTKDQFKYVKNIPQVDNKFETASGETVDWTDMNQLINQVATELDIDANKAIAGLQKDSELWNRLNRLKKKRSLSLDDSEKDAQLPSSSKSEDQPQKEDENQEDEEAACKNIIKQLLEESRLEDKLEEEEMECTRIKKAPNIRVGPRPSKSSKTKHDPEVAIEPDPDELPWCCICNKDATLRCLGCDGDLYCKRCYKEGHDREDYEDHPVKPYKPPAKK